MYFGISQKGNSWVKTYPSIQLVRTENVVVVHRSNHKLCDEKLMKDIWNIIARSFNIFIVK